LHFELRIMDTPVDPREWWDSHWLEDNIAWKVEAAVERLAALEPQTVVASPLDTFKSAKAGDVQGSN
jgi:hypothetical protein